MYTERWFQDKERGSFALAENWEVQLNEGSLSCKFVVGPSLPFLLLVAWSGVRYQNREEQIGWREDWILKSVSGSSWFLSFVVCYPRKQLLLRHMLLFTWGTSPAITISTSCLAVALSFDLTWTTYGILWFWHFEKHELCLLWINDGFVVVGCFWNNHFEASSTSHGKVLYTGLQVVGKFMELSRAFVLKGFPAQILLVFRWSLDI